MSKQTATIVGVIILLAAAAARLAGINQQLWLDEIWSIRLAQTAGSFSGVFVLHHDNNHWLNTLYLRMIGPGKPWWSYHLLAEMTGIGTVLFGWLLARRRGAWEGLAALLLLGASEFLVEFSTDARGYAPAGFFAMVSAWLLETHLLQPRRITAALLGTCGLLGVLSHLTFVVILAGLIAASAFALARRRSIQATIAKTLIWWAVPVAMIAALYFLDIRQMVRGGGPPTPDDLASQGAAMILGIPVGAGAAGICGIAAFFLCALRVRRMWRAAEALWPLFLTALLFAPGVLLFWPHSDYIHPRYVYVAVPLLLTALGIELGSWMRARLPLRIAATLALTGFVAVNGYIMSRFLRVGRGDYLGALRFMSAQTRGDELTVSTDHLHPKTTFMVLQYYNSYGLAPSARLATLKQEEWGQWPQWLVVEDDYGDAFDIDGTKFVRRQVFPTGATTSGTTWIIYEDLAGAPNLLPENVEDLTK